MKKISLIIFAIYYLLFTVQAWATPTPSPKTPSTENIDQRLKDLSNLIASSVARMKLVEKRGIIAKVTDVSDTQITVSDLHDNNKFIDVDELTRFSSPNAKESFGISDITKDAHIGVLGLYNKESRRILARFVDVINFPQIIHGVVDSINKENFAINITTEDGKKLSLDIETTTKTFSYSKSTGMTHTGFSKIKANDRIIAMGETNTKKNNSLTALRITLLPEIPISPNVNSTK